jgi:UDP-3-O-[3-hydroxymyristoyl] glucosamine N-acyltransferase
VNAVKSTYTVAELAEYLDAEWEGDSAHVISGLAALQVASSSQLGFIANAAYQKYLATTAAGAVILSPALREAYSGNKLIVDNPYLAFARVTVLFDPRRRAASGIHSSAQACSSGAGATPRRP